MFNDFFTTKDNSGQEIKLFGEKQQQHTIFLDSSQQIEYFELEKVIEPCNAAINNLKACDYVLVDNDSKKILLCELKNSSISSVITVAKEQLRHSKHIISLFLNVRQLDGYLHALLILSKRKINKRTTQTKKTQTEQYTETSQKTLKFNDLQYEKI